MALAYVQEYSSLAGDVGGATVVVGREPANVVQSPVDFTSGAAASAAFDKRTKFVRIIVDTDAHVQFGSNPTATSNDMVLPADTVEYFGVHEDDKVSFLAV